MWTSRTTDAAGLGRPVLEAIIEWCAAGIAGWPFSLRDGRPLYALHGFRPSNEMLLRQVPPR